LATSEVNPEFGLQWIHADFAQILQKNDEKFDGIGNIENYKLYAELGTLVKETGVVYLRQYIKSEKDFEENEYHGFVDDIPELFFHQMIYNLHGHGLLSEEENIQKMAQDYFSDPKMKEIIHPALERYEMLATRRQAIRNFYRKKAYFIDQREPTFSFDYDVTNSFHKCRNKISYNKKHQRHQRRQKHRRPHR